MKVLIIEDELIAAERLQSMLGNLDPELVVIEVLDSISGAKKWFARNSNVDLIFLDIQLADGLSFEIFKDLHVETPIIFTTAYDQYALRAFKLNSVDYLLKPIDDEELKGAVEKFKRNHTSGSDNPVVDTRELFKLLAQKNREYKERFVIKVGEHLKTVSTSDVRIFYSQDKATYLQTDGNKYIVDYALDQIEQMVDGERFFRINRKFIVSLEGIKDIITFSNSRLKIVLEVELPDDLIVARDRVNEFKAWLDK